MKFICGCPFPTYSDSLSSDCDSRGSGTDLHLSRSSEYLVTLVCRGLLFEAIPERPAILSMPGSLSLTAKRARQPVSCCSRAMPEGMKRSLLGVRVSDNHKHGGGLVRFVPNRPAFVGRNMNRIPCFQNDLLLFRSNYRYFTLQDEVYLFGG